MFTSVSPCPIPLCAQVLPVHMQPLTDARAGWLLCTASTCVCEPQGRPECNPVQCNARAQVCNMFVEHLLLPMFSRSHIVVPRHCCVCLATLVRVFGCISVSCGGNRSRLPGTVWALSRRRSGRTVAGKQRRVARRNARVVVQAGRDTLCCTAARGAEPLLQPGSRAR
jgi:hypothetical protein